MKMRKLAILAVWMVAISAQAREVPRADLEKARAHFKVAEGYFTSGAYDQAIAEYQAAYDLAPRPGLLFNLGAACRKKAEATGSLDDKKRSLDYYRRYLEAEPAGKAAADAKDFVDALTKEIAAAEAAVTAPEPASQPVEQPPVAEPAPVVAAPLAATPPPEVERPAGGAPLRIAGIVTGGAGIVLVATGVYFGLKSKSIADEVDGLTDHWDRDLYDSGQAAQRNAYICAGAGLAAVAGGAVMYFVLGKPDEPPAVTVTPSVTGSVGAVVVTGRF